jgi:tetratricopeptide (TPR) repeat protein
MGISLNNLGSVALQEGDLRTADQHLSAAIKLLRARLVELDNTEKTLLAIEDKEKQRVARQQWKDDVKRAKKTLSDRLGNYSNLMMQMKDYKRAHSLLDEAGQIDDEIGNVRGIVTKQSIFSFPSFLFIFSFFSLTPPLVLLYVSVQLLEVQFYCWSSEQKRPWTL